MEDEGTDNVIIEMLDSSEIPENELEYFQETQPLKVEDIVEESDEMIFNATTSEYESLKQERSSEETEETLIQKYVNGEVAFTDFYNSFDNNDDDDENENALYLEEDTTIIENKTTVQEPQLKEHKSRKEKKCYRKRSILTAALQGLMGEANLCFVRGKIEMAEKICLEIIRQNPLASEPFFTLAQIYENRDEEKFLEFLTIAAHLDPTNRDQWIRIAEINIEKNKYHEARICYSKAIKFFSKDYELRIMKAKLLEMIGEERDAMFTLMKMIAILPPENMNIV